MRYLASWILSFSIFSIICIYPPETVEARNSLRAAVYVAQLPSFELPENAVDALKIWVERELRRRGFHLEETPGIVVPTPSQRAMYQGFHRSGVHFAYEIKVTRMSGRYLVSLAELNVNPQRIHSLETVTLNDLTEFSQHVPKMLDGLLRAAQKGRVRHSSFRWGLGVLAGTTLGFDSRPDRDVMFLGTSGGALIRFSFEISSFRIDLESSLVLGFGKDFKLGKGFLGNGFVEIAALRAVYHPFLTNSSPYIGAGISFIAVPGMTDGTEPPMFGVGMSLNLGYEFFRFGDVHLLIELQINFPFLNQCGIDEKAPTSHGHGEVEPAAEFKIWAPSALLKLIVMW